MANTYKNKVVLSDGTILIDLTGITVTTATLAEGVTALDASGAPITGTMQGSVDGDNLAYGIVASDMVGLAVVGTAVLGSESMVGSSAVGTAIVGG